MESIVALREFHIQGSSREVGIQHGKYLTSEIAKNVAFYRKLWTGVDENWVKQYCENAKSRIQKFLPDMLEEIDGIAEGAGVEAFWILAINIRTEIYQTILAKNRNKKSGTECTTICVPANGILAQTWDWYQDIQATTAILHINKNNTPKLITYTEAGIVAKIGMNEKGMGVALNFLDCYQSSELVNIPVHMMLRKALECNSMDEWRTWFSKIEGGPMTSSAITIACGNPKEFISYELMNNKWFDIAQEASNPVFFRSNHYLTKETDHSEIKPSSSSSKRYNRCQQIILEENSSMENIQAGDVAKILQDESICLDFFLAPWATDLYHGTIVIIVMDLVNQVMHVTKEEKASKAVLSSVSFNQEV